MVQTQSAAARVAQLSLDAIDTVTALGATLEELETARGALLDELNAGIAAKSTHPNVTRNRQERAKHLVDRLTLPSALARQLWRSGVGKVGVRIDSRFVDVHQVAERDDGKSFDERTEIASVGTDLLALMKGIKS